jgi:hypothetical protein
VQQFSVNRHLSASAENHQSDERVFMIDLTNKKFNRLAPQEYLGKSMWLCVCDCGRIKAIDGGNIRLGRTKSCGCLQKETAHNLNLKPFGESALSNVFCSYQNSAKTRNIKFDLSREFVGNIIQKPCFYCGALPGNKQREGFFYNGIDRKNSLLGYEIDNAVPCCRRCNEMKRAIPYEEFIAKIKLIYERLDLSSLK